MRSRFVVCPVLVGRNEEIQALEQSAAEVARSGRTLLICGDAGIGKSRLATEARRIAEEAGLLVLSGHCARGASAPYAPLSAALRRYTRGLDDQALTGLFDGRARLAVTLLPEVAASLPPPDAVTAPEDLEAAVWHVLARITAQKPSLLLLEDLQWAGADMLRLLGSLVREAASLRLWIVGTYRSDEVRSGDALSALLAELARQRLFEELALRPLDAAQVRTMLRATLEAAEVGDEFSEAIVARTGGNPFFIEELCRALVERGDVHSSAKRWDRRALDEMELPATVRETLMERLLQLDAIAQHVLPIAAVAGARIDAAVITRAAGVDEATLGRVIIAGIDRQLLVEQREPGRHEYAFRHALTREVLSASLIGPQRRQAHQRVAEALAEVHADNLDEIAGRLADHLIEAGEAGRAVPLVLRAARRAAAAWALDEAMARYQEALEFTPPESTERLDLLIEAAECGRRSTGPVPSGPRPLYLVAAPLAAEALQLARSRGDIVAHARALAVAELERWRSGDVQGSLALLRETLTLVEGRRDRLELRTLATLVERQAYVGDLDHAQELLPRAVALASQLGDARQLARLRSLEEYLRGWGAKTADAYLEVVQQAELAGDTEEQFFALTWAGVSLLLRGHVEKARTVFSRAAGLAKASSPHLVGIAMVSVAGLETLVGNFATAMQIVDAYPADPSDVLLRMAVLDIRAEIDLWRGDVRRARAQADECHKLSRTGPETMTFTALAHRARAALPDGLATARPLFEEALRRAAEDPQGASVHWQFTPDFCRALCAAGLGDELSRWVSAVRTLSNDEDHRLNIASPRFCEGLLAMHRRDEEDARHSLQESADRYRSVPMPAREAQAQLALAELEWQANNVVASTEAGRSAQAIAIRLESPPLAAAAASALRRVGVRTPPPASVSAAGPVEHLSSREVEVAQLVAEGFSNAEISRRLFLSEHTVRNHVSNILGKLELRGRVDIARWATEQGLTHTGTDQDRR